MIPSRFRQRQRQRSLLSSFCSLDATVAATVEKNDRCWSCPNICWMDRVGKRQRLKSTALLTSIEHRSKERNSWVESRQMIPSEWLEQISTKTARYSLGRESCGSSWFVFITALNRVRLSKVREAGLRCRIISGSATHVTSDDANHASQAAILFLQGGLQTFVYLGLSPSKQSSVMIQCHLGLA